LWLKAAGFPQYVQMFEGKHHLYLELHLQTLPDCPGNLLITDGRFPINLSKFQVEKDHSFLDQSALDALIR